MSSPWTYSYSKDQFLRRVGNMAQVAGVESQQYLSGRMAGVQSLRISAGDLQLNVLPSRCLDIAQASYGPYPFGYISKSGIRNPAYFSEQDSRGFLDNFCGGLLTTSGLCNVGAPRAANGRCHGLHGEIANCPAEHVCTTEGWVGDQYRMSVSADMRHSRFYGEDLLFHRQITAALGQDFFCIDDTVENQDYADAPLMLLYHMNLGFPFLDSRSYLITSPIVRSTVRPGTDASALETFDTFDAPADGKEEACIYHEFRPDSDGMVTVCLFNPDLERTGLGVYLRYDPAQFPVFVQWKMLRSREYVCGFAPSTAHLEDPQKEADQIPLRPGAQKSYHVEIGVVHTPDAMRARMAGTTGNAQARI